MADSDLENYQSQVATLQAKISDLRPQLTAATAQYNQLVMARITASNIARDNPDNAQLRAAAESATQAANEFRANQLLPLSDQIKDAESSISSLQQQISVLKQNAAAQPAPDTAPPTNASAADAVNNDAPPPPATPPAAAVTEPPANSLSPEEQAQLEQAQSNDSEPVIAPATTDKKESDPEPGAKKTSTDLGAASVAGGSAPQTAGTFITTLQNPLHAYPIYTYNLSLHLMTDADYI
jgi:hypothetical protein